MTLPPSQYFPKVSRIHYNRRTLSMAEEMVLSGGLHGRIREFLFCAFLEQTIVVTS